MNINQRLQISVREYAKLSRESNVCLVFFTWLCHGSVLKRFKENVVVIDKETEKFLDGDGKAMFGDWFKSISRLEKVGAVNILDFDKGWIMINPYICYLGVRKDYLGITELWKRKLEKTNKPKIQKP
jgi:hypothetical protein